MQPRAARANCRSPAVLTPHRNQTRPSTVLHNPGALHHAIMISINHYHCVYVAVAQRFANSPYPYIATNLISIHHHKELTATMVGNLLATAERTCESSHCPLKDLCGNSGRRGTTNPKQYSKFRHIDPAKSPRVPSTTF